MPETASISCCRSQAEAERAKGNGRRNRKPRRNKKARKQAAIAEAVKEFMEKDLIGQADPNQAANPDYKPDVELKLKTALDRVVPRIAKRFEGKLY